MLTSTSLKMLRRFDSLIDEYQYDFCKYYQNAIRMLTSFNIFHESQRQALNKMTYILVGLHQHNRHLIIYIETLWSSITHPKHKRVKIELNYLKMITCKFQRLNNKVNLMNLTISQVWNYIYFVDWSINSYFKLCSIEYCRNALVNEMKLLKRLMRRLQVENCLAKRNEPISIENQILLLAIKLQDFKL